MYLTYPAYIKKLSIATLTFSNSYKKCEFYFGLTHKNYILYAEIPYSNGMDMVSFHLNFVFNNKYLTIQ